MPVTVTDPALLARTSPTNGMVDYRWTGPAPTQFNEAPMLAALVASGELPPVKERLPDEPIVIPPNEAIGRYGGTWRRVYLWDGDHAAVMTGGLQRRNGDGQSLVNEMARSWEITDGGREVTIGLHSGIKWSDGAPFTAEDFVRTWNNVVLNSELTAKFPERWKSPVSGNQPTVEEIDGLTVRFTWDDPNYPHIEVEMMGRTYDSGPGVMFSPSRYMAQFHWEFGDRNEIEAMMAEAELEHWSDLFMIKANGYREPDRPVLSAWRTVDPPNGPEWILERNPYYYAVDPAGNQLPYIDRVHLKLVKSLEAATAAAAAGEIHYQGRHMSLSRVPQYKEHADKANIYVQIASSTSPTGAVININQSHDEDAVIGELVRTRDFRRALSLALDREEINSEFFLVRRPRCGEGEQAPGPDRT